jgi:hypothetical protein
MERFTVIYQRFGTPSGLAVQKSQANSNDKAAATATAVGLAVQKSQANGNVFESLQAAP